MSRVVTILLIFGLALGFKPGRAFAEGETGPDLGQETDSRVPDVPVPHPLIPPPGKPAQLSQCQSVLTLIGGGVFLTALGGGIATWQDDRFHAWRKGKTAVGFGILLDMKSIEAKLDDSERALLRDPKGNALSILKMFSKKLSTGYDHKLADDGIKFEHYDYRDAADFFEGGEMEAKGVCRHKAAILHSILDKLGIPNRLTSGKVNFGNEPGDSFHAWVEIPEMGLVADPTGGMVLSAEDYYKTYAVTDGIEFYPRLTWELFSSNPSRK